MSAAPDEGMLEFIGACLKRFGRSCHISKFRTASVPGFQCAITFPDPPADPQPTTEKGPDQC